MKATTATDMTKLFDDARTNTRRQCYPLPLPVDRNNAATVTPPLAEKPRK